MKKPFKIVGIIILAIIGIFGIVFVITLIFPELFKKETKNNKIDIENISAPNGNDSLINKELEELRNEIQSLKLDKKSSLSVKTEVVKNEATIKSKIENGLSQNSNSEYYPGQSSVVLDSAARIFCATGANSITGSGSVWAYGDNYFLVTNLHVLESATKEGGACIVSIARDWNAVSQNFKQAHEDNNLLIYNIDPAYAYWDVEGFDFAITKLLEDEQPLSYLDEIAMVTNEAECNETISAGEKIKVIGFPYTGTFALPSITEGIISSFEKIGEMNYYLTSAKIEHGNSGGIAVTENYYCMVGIPTLSAQGTLESLGRILVMTEKDLSDLFKKL